jgi:uncharacterized protein (DUF305 family)
MQTKPLLYGLVGFFIGGFIVSVAATTFDKPETSSNANSNTASTIDHNAQNTSKLRDLKGDEFDKAFIREMIIHHQGAIDMAKLIETNAKHEELKNLAQDIITTQSKEIDMMQTWQADWGYNTTHPTSEENNIH